MDSVSGLGALSGLRRLSLARRRKIKDFSELRTVSGLEWLFLDSCAGLSNGAVLAEMRSLTLLSMNDCIGLDDVDWLRKRGSRRRLSVNGCHGSSLDFCADLPELRTLRAMFLEGVDDASALRNCRYLRRLELSLSRGRRHPLAAGSLAGVKSLTLGGGVTVEDLVSVSRSASFSELTAVAVDGLSDLTPLAELTNLRRLHLIDCRDLVSGNGLANLPLLEVLDLRGSSIISLAIPSACAAITEINLDRCPLVGGIWELASLRSLRKLVLPPTEEVVIDELRRMAEEAGNGALEIESDPTYSGYETG